MDWNFLHAWTKVPLRRHTLRGCVDWNIFTQIIIIIKLGVTPFVGVWIETKEYGQHQHEHNVTPFVGVWIETASYCFCLIWESGHTLRGCVDWNTNRWDISNAIISHTLRGCVDWNNNSSRSNKTSTMSHPSWVCGLKLSRYLTTLAMAASHPSWVCGLKQENYHNQASVAMSHPSWVCGLKLFGSRCLRYWI